MNKLKWIKCFFTEHDWRMPDGSYPTTGIHKWPRKGAVCKRCGEVAK